MLNKKRKFASVLAALSLFALVGCDTDEIKYPSNYTDKIYNNDFDKDAQDPKTAQDTLKQYYQSLTNDDAIYEKTVKKLLTILSDNVHNFDSSSQTGTSTYSVLNDTLTKKSVADSYTADAYKVNGEDNLLTRAKDTMVSTARSGSYKKDNLWDERSYAKYLEQNYYYLSDDYALSKDKSALKNSIVTPTMEFDDVYSKVNEKAYTKYMTSELYDDQKINYLTAEYILDKTPASIGNANARKVQVISIADRSDEPGDAKQILDKYVEDYIIDPKEGCKDDDFSVLSKLWKGITVSSLAEILDNDIVINDDFTYSFDTEVDDDRKTEIKAFYSRYLVTLKDDGKIEVASQSPVLNQKQTEWLKDVTGDCKSTLTGKILDDKKKIDDGLDNWHKLDTSLESTYTGSYTYDLEKGYRNAIDEIATRDLITDGVYLKSSGISALPSGLTDRIFSTRVTSSKDKIDAMKADGLQNGLTKNKQDLTVYAKDGYRYMTVSDTLSTDSTSSILYYDASSKTYYITRILDVVDTNAVTSGDTIYDTDAKMNQIKAEVAYAMSTTGSYKTDSAVYWLSRIDFTYSDEAFLEYIKSNYKDVFKTENPYSSEAKFDLTKGSFAK